MAVWHPDAKHVPYPDAGPYVKAGAKLCWHTTEGFSLPEYKGDAPHFTLNPKTGELWQHVPIDRASSALVHPPTVETNHANVVQVELIEFSKDSPAWTDTEYAHIAKLARWIEANHGVPRKCGVVFDATPDRQAKRMGDAEWLAYEGHHGHEHVPGNVHWDTGSMRIDKVLDVPASSIAFSGGERHTLKLIMAERARVSTPARRTVIRRCKAELILYRACIRAAAHLTGWDRSDRRRRYAALLDVYKGATVAL